MRRRLRYQLGATPSKADVRALVKVEDTEVLSCPPAPAGVVLQRIDRHPAREVHLLTPRLWKQHFADNPLRSDLDHLPG